MCDNQLCGENEKEKKVPWLVVTNEQYLKSPGKSMWFLPYV